jgi:hypothetical protein
MIRKLKKICVSKANIFAVSLSLFALLKDFHELITGFASHLIILAITIIILFILLIVHFSMDGKHEEVSNPKSESENNGKFDIRENNQKRWDFSKFSSFFSKLLFSGLLFFISMGLISLYYVKKLDVYYVVLANNLTEKEARKIMLQTNSSEIFNQLNLSTRYIPMPVGNEKYELILYNGYVSPQKADKDLEKVKSIQNRFNPYRVGPQKTPSFLKKIKYLQKNLFS